MNDFIKSLDSWRAVELAPLPHDGLRSTHAQTKSDDQDGGEEGSRLQRSVFCFYVKF